MSKANKNVPNGKKSGSGNFLKLQAYSKGSSHRLSKHETIIGKDVSIEGNISGKQHMLIDGSVKGTIEVGSHNFALGPDGRVEGEIHAGNICISGKMKGNIKTPGKIKITEEADFQGDILAKSITVENGAFFNGSVALTTEPRQKAFSTEKSIAKKAQV